MKINNLYNKTWKKCIIIFIIVFLIVSVGGYITITYLDNFVSENNFHTDYIVVQNKSTVNYDFYIITDISNKSYIINSNNDNYDKKLYDMIEIGQRYKVVLQDPKATDINQTTYIIQAYNDTS